MSSWRVVLLLRLLGVLFVVVPFARAKDTLYDGARVTKLERAPRGQGSWVVNFYAPWCGHCREYSKTYKTFAARAPPDLQVGVLSCVAHKEACAKEGVTSWPTVKAYGMGGADAVVVDERSVDGLVAFVTSRTTIKFLSPKEATTAFSSSSSKAIKKVEAHRWAATPTVVRENAGASLRYAMESADLTEFDRVKRGELTAFLATIFRAIPELSLAGRFLQVLRRADDDDDRAASTSTTTTSTTTTVSASSLTVPWNEVLNSSVEAPTWTPLCDPESRGRDGTAYTCGLWLLFHVLVDRAADTEAALGAIRTFVDHFFACAFCRDHFLQMFDRCDYQRPFCVVVDDAAPEEREERRPNLRRNKEGSLGGGRDEVVLWLWRAHNAVNARVHGKVRVPDKFAKDAYADLPAGDWAFPSADLCRDCRRSGLREVKNASTFDEGRVLAFLRRYYGSTNGRYYSDDDDDDDDRASSVYQSLSSRKALFLLGALATLLLFFFARSSGSLRTNANNASANASAKANANARKRGSGDSSNARSRAMTTRLLR